MKVIVTGGASGLGEAITRRFAGNNANTVYFTYNHSKEKATMLEKEFSNTKSFHVDFTNDDSVELFINELPKLAADVLINNAITGFTQVHFHKMDPSLFANSFKHNIDPVIRITQKFIAESRKRKSGKIITILTSALINKPPVGYAEYVANKAYLHSMVKSWATENAAMGITSNSISPAFMETNLNNKTDSRVIENLISSNPNKQLLKEEEVADAVLFLANASSQINGNNIIINAGENLL
jgi:3-oxoacyl-[acyl-carrier protein] reductase